MKLENELVEAGLLGDAATADLLMAADYFFHDSRWRGT